MQHYTSYLSVETRETDRFLAQQSYDPSRVADGPYLVTFNIHNKAYARVITPEPFQHLDFADLYGTPWNRYKLVGYNEFWISRTDRQDLSPEEISDLDKSVTDDLRFDYAEDELAFWFDPDTIEGVLGVSVQDVESNVSVPVNGDLT